VPPRRKSRRQEGPENADSALASIARLFGITVRFVLFQEISQALYFTANSFSHNSSDSLAPSSDSHTDLFFAAGLEM
jgi:hypothetical protein